jgi:ribonuclease BN (tRNA processing enzyme)
MELIILGSGTCVPSLTRGSPGLLVRVGNELLVVDSGSGTLGRLLKTGVTYNDIDRLCYTHIHPDHTADLVPCLFACNYGDAPRKRELQIIAGGGFRRFFNNLKSVYHPWMEPQQYQLSICEVEADRLDFGGFSLITRPMKHTESSVGYRLETGAGRSITISGDTDYCRDIVELARGTDLLVLECSSPNRHKLEGHLTPEVAGRIATEAGCRRLLLTHFYPVCDQYDIAAECRTAYAGELILAEDGMRVTV